MDDISACKKKREKQIRSQKRVTHLKSCQPNLTYLWIYSKASMICLANLQISLWSISSSVLSSINFRSVVEQYSILFKIEQECSCQLKKEMKETLLRQLSTYLNVENTLLKVMVDFDRRIFAPNIRRLFLWWLTIRGDSSLFRWWFLVVAYLTYHSFVHVIVVKIESTK